MSFIFPNMSKTKADVRRHVLEKSRSPKEKEKTTTTTQTFLSKHLKKIYPLGLQRSNSSTSLSSASSSLSSQNSLDSSHTGTTTQKDQKSTLPLPSPTRNMPLPLEKKEILPVPNTVPQPSMDSFHKSLKRCCWITKNSDKVYVQFHDEQWGVPVYDDNILFELLAMSGMLMDYNWTEILKKKEALREAFAGFDPNSVAKMGEEEISEIGSNKTLMLAESRVRCVVENAKCILKIVGEYSSFSDYLWEYMNYKPIINIYRHPRKVPIRTPKAETISRDLVRRGFRLAGPVIVHSFMQAAGMTNDHLVDCFRFRECVSLAERPWRHV
ncbi:Methyladenine glycosylase [Dillenia turbinata]|uniref:Methyladenine glycosylase n=1 Tax=Dillenia turbinata TaxID=194707 RepID=A0AAN8Z3X0_9MAGN